MKYLVVQDWINTSNNHAGMKYLAIKMQEMHPEHIKVLEIPDYINIKGIVLKRNGFIGSIWSRIVWKYSRVKADKLFKRRVSEIIGELLGCLSPGDEVVIMEYMENLYPLLSIPIEIKKNVPQAKVSAIIHLVPSKLDCITDMEFTKWIRPVDRVITLGHSLSDYLERRGIERSKILTSFHYVDDYYKCNERAIKDNERIKVIAMGNQMRNVEILKSIVSANSSVDFVICQGVADLQRDFSEFTNVTLVPFVSEEKLRNLMEDADVSLNVMVDTIGSNVIVTSMAMGLAMINSDVGSIRDYCDETNSIFCNNNSVKSFNDAISLLASDRQKMYDMQNASIHLAKKLSIEHFYAMLR